MSAKIKPVSVKTTKIKGSLKEWGPLEKVRQIRRGIRYSVFESLKSQLGATQKALSQNLDISEKTLERRQGSSLSPAESEKVLRLQEIFETAVALFGSREAASHWIFSPQPYLGGVPPISLCDTDVGAREVGDLLGRIEHGVLA